MRLQALSLCTHACQLQQPKESEADAAACSYSTCLLHPCSSNFLWALAKLGKPEAEFFAAAAAHAARTIHTYTPQALANLIWSYATLAIDPGAVLVQQVVGMMKQSLPEYTPQVKGRRAQGPTSLGVETPSPCSSLH